MYLELNPSLGLLRSIPARTMDLSYISPSIDGQQLEQGHDSPLQGPINVIAVRIKGRGGVRVIPNIVRIVMHVGIYGRSLTHNSSL